MYVTVTHISNIPRKGFKATLHKGSETKTRYGVSRYDALARLREHEDIDDLDVTYVEKELVNITQHIWSGVRLVFGVALGFGVGAFFMSLALVRPEELPW